MKRMLTLGVLTVAVLVTLVSRAAAPKNDLDDFMRAKLVHSQRVVEGLCLSDFDKIAKHAQEMSLLSLAATWQVLQTPQYIEHSRKFRNAADSLADAAKKKNLDKATEAYNQVTLRCVECHKYLRDVRMAQVELDFSPRVAVNVSLEK